jgi:hypothetical protein
MVCRPNAKMWNVIIKVIFTPYDYLQLRPA